MVYYSMLNNDESVREMRDERASERSKIQKILNSSYFFLIVFLIQFLSLNVAKLFSYDHHFWSAS